MTFDAINAIVKERWQTGAYGHAHFRMRQDLLDAMPAPPPDATPRFPNGFGNLRDLLSIPVVVDDQIPDGEWRLVDNSTREILAAGTVTL